MKTERQITNAILKSVARAESRSPLFWWMVAHHGELAARTPSRIRWKTLCETFATLGLTDTRGLPPTERNARETWRQVRIEVAMQRESLAAADQVTAAGKPRSKPPCRMSPDWRPQEVPSSSLTRHPAAPDKPSATPPSPVLTDILPRRDNVALTLTLKDPTAVDLLLERLAKIERKLRLDV